MKPIRWTLILIHLCSNVSGQTGPGGIGANANLAFWLDANTGALSNPLNAWNDISGNNISTTVNGNPTYVTNVINGMGVVRFDGNGDEVYTELSINAVNWPLVSVMAVYIPRITHAGSVWGEDNGQWDRFQTDVTLVPQLISTVSAGYDPTPLPHPCVDIANLFVTNAASLSTATYNEDLYLGTHVYVNGASVATFTSTATAAMENGTSNFYVGAIGSGGFRFNGDIAEIIVFQSDLTQTHRIIAENYLAAKYGLALTANDLYNEDDLGFDFDVAGIGSLGPSIHNNSRGSGIVRMWNPSDLNNGEFLFWGHDNGTLQAVNTTDVPAGVQARSARIWKVSEVNTAGTSVDVGTINVSFNLANLGSITASDLRLLIDTDNDGVFADETPLGSASFLGNNEYSFTAVNAIANNLRFTIATVNVLQTPLPVKLKYFYALTEEESVVLKWQSVVEKNISAYAINRSSDGVQWTHLGKVSATGSGKYSFTDDTALAGTAYYRLTEIDFDSREVFCGIVSAKKTKSVSLSPFPNPTKNYLTIPFRSSDKEYRVLATSGMDCTKHTRLISRSETQATIDVSALSPGQFFISVNNQQGFHFIKEGPSNK